MSREGEYHMFIYSVRFNLIRYRTPSRSSSIRAPSIIWSTDASVTAVELGTGPSHISEFSTPARSPSAESSIISWPATPVPHASEPIWGAQPTVERGASYTPPIFSPQPTPWTQQFPSPHTYLSLDSLSPPSSWGGISQSTSRAPSSGPVRVIRRKRGQIQPSEEGEGAEDGLDFYRSLDTSKAGFRFCARSYLCTWSQIGDTPNSAMEDFMISFGNQIKGMLV